jgi:hypothetical protein
VAGRNNSFFFFDVQKLLIAGTARYNWSHCILTAHIQRLRLHVFSIKKNKFKNNVKGTEEERANPPTIA